MATNQNNILDFEDPGMLADELMHVPGFVNELMCYTLAVSPRPNKPLAFAGALAMTAHLSGRTYRDVRGTRTNLYLAALAPSGMGKDEPRVVNKRLADGAGSLASVPDSIASGQGLEDAMAESPSLLLQCDEADTLLTKRMLYMAQFYVAEGKFDRLKKRAMGLLAKHGGSLSRAKFVHSLNIDSVTFKKLISTLEMCNLIESECGDYGKAIYHLTAA